MEPNIWINAEVRGFLNENTSECSVVEGQCSY